VEQAVAVEPSPYRAIVGNVQGGPKKQDHEL
jgi:hypothetical protein